MKNKRWKKTILFLIIIIIIVLAIILGYSFFIAKENPLEQILNNSNNKEYKSVDNYNGIYAYNENLDTTYYIYSGCTITKLNYYIVVINNEYTTYKSTCMGTYLQDSGQTENLNIKEENDDYIIEYNDHTYSKTTLVKSIEPQNSIKSSKSNINVNSYKFVIEQTEFEGNYYIYSGRIDKLNQNLTLNFSKQDDNSFKLIIYSRDMKNPTYSTIITDFEYLPDLYIFGDNLVIIEKNYLNSKSNYNFYIISDGNTSYDINDYFPITVNHKPLTTDYNRIITYDSENKEFVLLVSENDSFCTEESESTEISYYKFVITYSYLTGKFSTPEFSEVGYLNEGCGSIKKYIGG